MRVLLAAIAALLLAGCKEQKAPVSIAYLNKDAVFNKDSVRSFLNHVPEEQADSSKSAFLKGIGLIKNNSNATAAIVAFKQSLAIYPTANAYYELGNAYLQTKKWKMALQSFEMAEAMNFTPLENVLFG